MSKEENIEQKEEGPNGGGEIANAEQEVMVPERPIVRQIGNYTLGQELGSGAFGKVMVGSHILTGETVAIKILDKIILSQTPEDLELVNQEIAILKIVKHNNIVQLYEIMETPQHIFIVMEYCDGKDLMDYILTKSKLSENESLKLFQQLINALIYLHSQNIAHRDIKIDNMLLDSKKNLKLVDFGLSTKYSDDELLNQPCGTVVYAAPEVLEGKEYHGMLADVWSSGIVLFGMLSGYLPFCDQDDEINKENVLRGDLEIPESFPPLVRDLLSHMLDMNPMTRYTLQEIQDHPWFNSRHCLLLPGIIIGINSIPIDERIINMIDSFGMNKEEVRKNVERNKFDAGTALYYLLVRKVKSQGYNSVSDMCSVEFVEFISNPKNFLGGKDEAVSESNLKETTKVEVVQEPVEEPKEEKKNTIEEIIIDGPFPVNASGEQMGDEFKGEVLNILNDTIKSSVTSTRKINESEIRDSKIEDINCQLILRQSEPNEEKEILNGNVEEARSKEASKAKNSEKKLLNSPKVKPKENVFNSEPNESKKTQIPKPREPLKKIKINQIKSISSRRGSKPRTKGNSPKKSNANTARKTKPNSLSKGKENRNLIKPQKDIQSRYLDFTKSAQKKKRVVKSHSTTITKQEAPKIKKIEIQKKKYTKCSSVPHLKKKIYYTKEDINSITSRLYTSCSNNGKTSMQSNNSLHSKPVHLKKLNIAIPFERGLQKIKRDRTDRQRIHFEGSVVTYRKRSPGVRDLSYSPKNAIMSEKNRIQKLPWNYKKKGIDTGKETDVYQKYKETVSNMRKNKLKNRAKKGSTNGSLRTIKCKKNESISSIALEKTFQNKTEIIEPTKRNLKTTRSRAKRQNFLGLKIVPRNGGKIEGTGTGTGTAFHSIFFNTSNYSSVALYEGPIDIDCIAEPQKSLEECIQYIESQLRKHSILYLNTKNKPHRFRCTKNGENCEIEIFRIQTCLRGDVMFYYKMKSKQGGNFTKTNFARYLFS